MPAAAASALALLLAAVGDARVELGGRAEERTRSYEQDRVRTTLSALDLAPTARLVLGGDAATAALGYLPRLRVPDLGAARLTILHAVEARVATRPGEPWLLRASATGARGEVDLVTLGRDRTELQALPTVSTLRVRSARAEAAAEARPDPRTRLLLEASWAFAEGDDAASRLALPPARTFVGAATLGWAGTRRDALSARLNGSWMDFVLDRRTLATVTAEAGWRRSLSRELAAWLFGGASWYREEAPGERTLSEVLPAGEVGAALATGREVTASLAARVRTAVDRVLERIEQRLEGEGTLAWVAGPGWTVYGSALAALTRRTGGDLRLGRAELRLDRGLAAHATLGGGVYGQWQQSDDRALPSFTEAGLFVAIALEPPARPGR